MQNTPHVCLRPVTIARDANELCLIEPSINSVRVSARVRQSDDTEKMLAKMLMRFISHRADQFHVLRRKPVDGYDISFLITSQHLETMEKAKLVDFILLLLEDIDKEIKDMKLNLNTRLRAATLAYMQQIDSGSL